MKIEIENNSLTNDSHKLIVRVIDHEMNRYVDNKYFSFKQYNANETQTFFEMFIETLCDDAIRMNAMSRDYIKNKIAIVAFELTQMSKQQTIVE